MSDEFGGFDNSYLDPSEYSLQSTPWDTDNYWAGSLNGYLNSGGGGENGSTIMNLIKKYLSNTSGQRDLAKTLGSFSSGEKANRVIKGNFTQNYDRLKLAAQEARNANETDAMDKLRATSYIMGGGSKFDPGTLSLNGKTYNVDTHGIGPQAPTEEEKQGAADLQAQVRARLKPGGSYSPQDLASYAEPGTLENIGSYGGAVVGGLGAISSMMGGPDGGGGSQPVPYQGGPSTGQKVMSGLGTAGTVAGIAQKAGLLGHAGTTGTTAANTASVAGNLAGRYLMPGVGAALGIYGLSQNKGGASNVMSGMGTGASIGTMVAPGIGTAVGAGLGAAYGGLQNLFTVTGKEKEGRAAHANVVGAFTSGATDAEKAEARLAGWADPNQALSLIVIRDALVKSGLDPAAASKKAEQIKLGMYDAEKHGQDDVAKAAAPLSTLRG